MIFKYLTIFLYAPFLIANNNCMVDNEKAPQWVCEPTFYSLKYNTSVGVVAKGNLPFKIIKKLAVSNARVNLAETLKVKVQSEINMNTSSITHNNKEVVSNETIDSIHTVSKEKISNYTILETWQNKNNFYVLVGIPLN